MWYPPIALVTVLLVGMVVSLLTRSSKPARVNPKLIIPIGDVCCCCLPKQIRRWFRCSVDKDENDLNTQVCEKLIESSSCFASRRLMVRVKRQQLED